MGVGFTRPWLAFELSSSTGGVGTFLTRSVANVHDRDSRRNSAAMDLLTRRRRRMRKTQASPWWTKPSVRTSPMWPTTSLGGVGDWDVVAEGGGVSLQRPATGTASMSLTQGAGSSCTSWTTTSSSKSIGASMRKIFWIYICIFSNKTIIKIFIFFFKCKQNMVKLILVHIHNSITGTKNELKSAWIRRLHSFFFKCKQHGKINSLSLITYTTVPYHRDNKVGPNLDRGAHG